MDPARPSKRLSTVALVMLGWIAIGLAAPLVMSFQRGDFELVPPTVNAAPRDSFVVASPVPISSAPQVSVDRGTVYLVNPGSKPLTGAAAAELLASGSTRLMLEGGTVNLRLVATADGAVASTPDALAAPIAAALARQGFEALLLRRSTLVATLPDGRTEVLTEVTGELTLKRKGPMLLKGAGQLRGQAATFDATLALAGDGKATKSLPIKLQLKSGALDATIDGALVAGSKPGFQGQLDAAMPRVRALARLFAGGWTSGPGLRDLKLKGTLDWSEQGLAVNSAQFSMDGSEATGALVLKLSTQRPSLSGTVAYKTLDLQPYFSATKQDGMRLSAWWSWLTGGDISASLVRQLDADLRISADRVRAAGVEAGRTAAALTVKDGRLLTNIADLELKGGAGSGQISIDYTGSQPKVVVRGKIERIEAAGLSESLLGSQVLSGPATIVADLTAAGLSTQELYRSATGKLSIALRDGGRIGIDLRTLLGLALKRELEGWPVAPRGATAFEVLDMKLAVRNGEVTAEQAQIGSGEASVTASGTVNLTSGRLDARVLMGGAATPTGKPDALLIDGALASPRIRSESASRAAQPTPERASQQTRG